MVVITLLCCLLLLCKTTRMWECVWLWITAGSTPNISSNNSAFSRELCFPHSNNPCPPCPGMFSVLPGPGTLQGEAVLGTYRRLQTSSPERGVSMGCRVRGGGFLLLVQRGRDEVLSSRERFGHARVERRELETGRLSSRSLNNNKKLQDQERCQPDNKVLTYRCL